MRSGEGAKSVMDKALSFKTVGWTFLVGGALVALSWAVIAFLVSQGLWESLSRFGLILVGFSTVFPIAVLTGYFIVQDVVLRKLHDRNLNAAFLKGWLGYGLAPYLGYVLVMAVVLTLFDRAAWVPYPHMLLGILMALYGAWLLRHQAKSAH